jgi:serine/threonine protein kinase
MHSFIHSFLPLLQIIRGSFTPLPTSRSKELRELVTSMLNLDASRRPSANQLLAMPVLRARIQNFLTRSLQVRAAAGAYTCTGVCTG